MGQRYFPPEGKSSRYIQNYVIVEDDASSNNSRTFDNLMKETEAAQIYEWGRNKSSHTNMSR
jgi:hypothetical protein